MNRGAVAAIAAALFLLALLLLVLPKDRDTQDAPTLPPTQPATEPSGEPSTRPVAEPPTKPVTEPVTEPPSQPVTEPPTEPVTDPSTGPVTEPTTDPSTEPPTEPPTEPTKPPTQPPSEPTAPSARPQQGSGSLSPLAVRGTRLVNAAGEPVQLRGVSTHGLAWFPQFVNEALFAEMAQSWGVNAVRLALYTAEYGGWCTGGDRAALKKLVLDGVDYAERAGLYVIVDWHILSDGNPNAHKAEAVAFFREISALLAQKTHVLYEICNEPNGGTTWQDIAAYAREVIPVIRQNDPDCVILVGTPNWSQRVDEAVRAPLSEFDNIMYTLHFYAGTHRADLRNTMLAALDAGLPIFVSEFGITDASGNGGLDEAEADRWTAALNERGVSYLMWSLSNKAEDSAAIRSSCAKTSGLTESDLTTAGKWLLRTLSGTAPALSDPSTPPEPPSTTPPEPSDTSPAAQPEPSDPPAVAPPTTPPSETAENVPWLTADLTLVNEWTSADGAYRQYAVTVTNTTGAPVESWQAQIVLDAPFAIDNVWNAAATASGRTLTLTNAPWNATLAPNATLQTIGLILRLLT